MTLTWENFFFWFRIEDLNAETSGKMKAIKINLEAPLCLISNKKLPSFSLYNLVNICLGFFSPMTIPSLNICFNK